MTRLTTAQAIVGFLKNQYVQRDGRESKFFAGMLGIFGHGNVAGIGQALQENLDFPYILVRNEQSAVHLACGFTSAVQDTGDLEAAFSFSADLNGKSLAEATPSAPSNLEPAFASAPIGDLYTTAPNALTINREAGTGTLFYRAALHAERPVQGAEPLSAGMTVNREYVDASCEIDCPAITSINLEAGAQIQARVTLTVPHDAYYLALEDYIPAGAEILNTSLKTSQLGIDEEPEAVPQYDPSQPYSEGWGWGLFRDPQIYDDRISWAAGYLPAGTYQLTYTLVLLQPGEYRLLPARAWQFYFPEVQENSPGGLFTIEP